MKKKEHKERRIILNIRRVKNLERGKYQLSVFTTSHNETLTQMKDSKYWGEVSDHETITLDINSGRTKGVVLYIILHKKHFWKTGQIGRFQLPISETFTRDFWHERTLSMSYFDAKEQSHKSFVTLRIEVRIENFGSSSPLRQYPFYVLFSPEYQYQGILRHIFSYLTANDLHRSISMVSKHCWKLMRRVTFLDEVNIPFHFKTREFSHFLETYKNITNLRIQSYGYQDFEVPQALQLTRLSIGTIHRDNPAKILKICPNLTHFTINRISHERRWEDLLPNLNIDCEISDFVEPPTKTKNQLRILKIFSTDKVGSLDDTFLQFLDACPYLEMISCPEDYFFQECHSTQMIKNIDIRRRRKKLRNEEQDEEITLEIELVKERNYEEYFMDQNGLHWVIEYEKGVAPIYEDCIVISPRFFEEFATCYVIRVRIDASSEGNEDVTIRREFTSGFSAGSDSFKVLRFSKDRSCRHFRIQIKVLELYNNFDDYDQKKMGIRHNLLSKNVAYPIRLNEELDLSRESLLRFETLYTGELVLQKDVWIHAFLFRICVTFDERCRRFTVYIVSMHAREYIVSCAIRLVFNGTKREIDHAVFDGRGGYGWNDLLEDEEDRDQSRIHLFFAIHRIFDRDEYSFFVKEKYQRWSRIRNLFFNRDAQNQLLINETKTVVGLDGRSTSPPPRVVSDVFQNQKTKKTVQLFLRPRDATYFEAQQVMFELYGIRWVLSFHPNRGKFGRSAFFLRCEDLMGANIMRIRWLLRGDVFRTPLRSTTVDYFQDRVWGFDEVHIRKLVGSADRKADSTLFEIEVEVQILEVFPEDKYFAGQKFLRDTSVRCNKKEEIILEIKSKGVENPIQTDNILVCGVPFMLEFYSDGLKSKDKISAVLYHRMEIHYIITGNYQFFCIDEKGTEYSSQEVIGTDEHKISFFNICDKNLQINWKVRVVVEIISINCHSETLPTKEQSQQMYSK